jgi:hypothetical protein
MLIVQDLGTPSSERVDGSSTEEKPDLSEHTTEQCNPWKKIESNIVSLNDIQRV